jgi:hypothetical protein
VFFINLALRAQRVTDEHQMRTTYVCHAEIRDRRAEVGAAHGDADHQAESEDAVNDLRLNSAFLANSVSRSNGCGLWIRAQNRGV